MKKIIFMLAAFVLCFQIAAISQTRVGISGGVAVANMKGKVNGDSRSGVMTGLVLETPLGKSFTFRPTLSYVQKGQNQPSPGLVDKLYIALRYAEFNADFLYYIGGVKSSVFIGAGPSVDFNLPSKKVSETAGVKSVSTINFGKVLLKDMRGVDFGANFTAGWRSKSGLFISLNYNKGLRNLVIENDPGSLKNQYFGAQLGFFLNNGKAAK